MAKGKQERTFDMSVLRRIRIKQGLSLREVGERAGVAASTVYRMEQGRDTSISAVVRIANALGYMLVLQLPSADERRALFAACEGDEGPY
jgi:transcriptional regulator with XRE-family HTH domain